MKLIIVGDTGQLPSVAAGGWFAAISDKLDGPQLRQVIRQRDPAEREALEELHDGDPGPYIALKRGNGALAVREREEDALVAILDDWNRPRRELGTSEAVMIARDNATREMLNDSARPLLIRHGELAADGVAIVDREFRVGDRVIARRNDRYRSIDNGTLGRVAELDCETGVMTLITDSGQRGQLDATYVCEHVEHALTGHGTHGATVEWAGVISRPTEFTRQWSYTSLSRARGRTRVHVVADPRNSASVRTTRRPSQSG